MSGTCLICKKKKGKKRSRQKHRTIVMGNFDQEIATALSNYTKTAPSIHLAKQNKNTNPHRNKEESYHLSQFIYIHMYIILLCNDLADPNRSCTSKLRTHSRVISSIQDPMMVNASALEEIVHSASRFHAWEREKGRPDLEDTLSPSPVDR